jgi:hypothetical protein
MSTARWASLALVTTAAFSVGAMPAQAASSPQIRSTGSTVTFVNQDAVVEVRYRCAPGADLGIDAVLWQGGNAEDPVTEYVTGVEDAVCDGEKHTTTIELRMRDWDSEWGGPYPFLTPKSEGGERAHLTVALTEPFYEVVESDDARLRVVAG